MEFHKAVRKHIEKDKVAWLTTVTEQGAPSPTPVWFVADGDGLLIFSEPSSRKVANVVKRPQVTVHFDSDPDGQDIVVLRGKIELVDDVRPSARPDYVEKYRDAIHAIGMTVNEFDSHSSAGLRFRPTGVWLGPAPTGE